MVGTVGATTMSSFDELMEKLQDKSNECLDELQDKSNELENELEDRIENNIDDKLDYLKEETIEHIIDLLRS
jgi:predicted transcriptional regulator